MDKNKKQIPVEGKSYSAAILFLRLFIGAVMLLHIIGKMQTYDNLVLEYNSFLGMSPATSLALSMIVEGILAAMIIIGFATRLAAMLMVAATIVTLIDVIMTAGISMVEVKLQILYLGIFLTLAISGGGVYAYRLPR